MRGPEGAPVQQCTGATRQTGGTLTEIHQQIADLLRSPPPVRVGGNAEDVHGPGADLHHEQAVQALESHRAVHMEEVGGKHRRPGCTETAATSCRSAASAPAGSSAS